MANNKIYKLSNGFFNCVKIKRAVKIMLWNSNIGLIVWNNNSGLF